MKHVPLIGNMSRDGFSGGGGFGQLLNDDEEEGTECVIDDFPRRPEADPSDDAYHPPMCGQALLSKVMRSKKKKAVRGMLAPRNPLFSLRQRPTSFLGYHETFSLEQAQDSASESGTASHTSSRDRSADPSAEGGTTPPPPPYILQFDPNDLTVIQTEKERSDAATTQSSVSPASLLLGNKKSSTVQSLLKGGGKHGRKSSSSSPFCPIVLPTVTEEKSFDLLESPSAEASPCQNPTHLLPSVSSTSSSSCSSFFGRVNSTDSRDDDVAELAATVSDRTDPVVDAAPTAELMQILTAMRQIILKQQDAIQAVSQENVAFRQQLVRCQAELRTIQTESAEQLVQITQLVLQKQGLEDETARLKAELEGLRQEVSALQCPEEVEEEEDLAHRFASLMGDEEEDEEEEEVIAAATEQVPPPASSPMIHVDNIVDDASWRRLLSSFDTASMDESGTTKSPPRQTAIPKEEEEESKGPARKDRSSPGRYSQALRSTAVEDHNSSSSCETSPLVDRRTADVVEFKSRLEEMQQKRLRRARGPGRKSPSVRFA